MTAARLIVTATSDRWVHAAAAAATGYAASVIGCDAEAGVERWLSSKETPDSRPGVTLIDVRIQSGCACKKRSSDASANVC